VRAPTFFQRKSEVDVLARKLPVDGGKEPPAREPVHGSVPVDDLADLAFPSLRRDLEAFRE
jgi:hypothetical protein